MAESENVSLKGKECGHVRKERVHVLNNLIHAPLWR